MKTATLSIALFMFCSALVGAKSAHAPLAPVVLSAKTIFIENLSGRAEFADRCYDELGKWGRYKIVTDKNSADLIFQITSQTKTTGMSGRVDDNGNMNLSNDTYGFTTISVLSASGEIIWSDTHRWGNLFTGFHSATRAVVKEFRKRVEEQEK